MTLSIQELGGSPTEQYSFDGFTATRQFLIPWEQRQDFALAVFGTSAQLPKDRRLLYPGRRDVYAYSLRFEPFDPDAVGVRSLTDITNDIVDYNGSYVKAVVEYHTTDKRDRIDGPINEEGTSITYRMLIQSEEQELPAANWHWSDTHSAVPPETLLIKHLPFTELKVTWSQVVNPPWEAITFLQGKLNDAAFLGCNAETLLFMEAEANKLYRPGSGLDDGPSSFVWAIQYLFRERTIKMNGNTYGWNHVYRPATGTWQTVNNAGSPLYDSGDFNTLFATVTPEDVP